MVKAATTAKTGSKNVVNSFFYQPSKLNPTYEKMQLNAEILLVHGDCQWYGATSRLFFVSHYLRLCAVSKSGRSIETNGFCAYS